MAIRFRKSFKIAPGTRLNVGMNGLGLNVGPRGASVSFTRRGTYANVGLPGTGLSARQLLSPPPGSARQSSSPASAPPPASESVGVHLRFTDEGQIRYLDSNDDPLPDAVVKALRRNNKAAIEAGLQAACERVNAEVDAVTRLHVATPKPRSRRRHVPAAFPDVQPELRLQPLSLWQRLLPPLKAQALKGHDRARAVHAQAVAEWEAAKAEHDALQAAEVARVASLSHDVLAMEGELESAFSELEWPRETIVAYALEDGGAMVQLDVDLPEVEDMPRQIASVPARADRLVVKTMGEAKVRELYARHIHAVVFRLVGVVFNRLPAAKLVTVSGYSQRPDKATGHAQDDYLLSIQVSRDSWAGINFDDLAALDPLVALDRFDLRREMTAGFLLRPVEPFTVMAASGAAPESDKSGPSA